MDGLGAAISACGSSYKQLGAICIFFEIDPACQSVLCEHYSDQVLSLFPDVRGAVSSVLWLTENNFANLKSILRHRWTRILVAEGSPCVGFSRAKKHARGIDDPASNLMWVLPSLASYCASACPSAEVTFTLENVVPQQDGMAQRVDRVMAVEHMRTSGSWSCWCRRERLVWTNLPTPKEWPALPALSTVLEVSWYPAWELLEAEGVGTHKRFGVFMRAFPPGCPGECEDLNF